MLTALEGLNEVTTCKHHEHASPALPRRTAMLKSRLHICNADGEIIMLAADMHDMLQLLSWHAFSSTPSEIHTLHT